MWEKIKEKAQDKLAELIIAGVLMILMMGFGMAMMAPRKSPPKNSQPAVIAPAQSAPASTGSGNDCPNNR